LENIPHALDVHAQRVLKYNFILIYDCTVILPKRCNTTKEFSIAFYVKLKKIELSYRIHLKFNLSDTHISWKGYLIGSCDLNCGK
jgi:hypothetical protein